MTQAPDAVGERIDSSEGDAPYPTGQVIQSGSSNVASVPLGEASTVQHGSWRHRMRTNRVTHQVYRVVVLVVGLLFIAGGVALSVLPGPLTIPPVLVGLWVWSTEFAWAQRLFQRFKVKGREAWEHAKRHPVSSSAITLSGVVAVVVGVWALRHFQVIATVREAVGL